MKMKFGLLCGLMAIALAACTGEELMQTENMQKPAGGKVISVKAYTPREQPVSRLVFEDQGTEGLKLSWSENDAFTAIVGNEELTFTYDPDSKEFIGTLPEGVGLTNGTKAYYPAYTGEYAADLSDQTGSLNSATTYMVGEYDETIQAFRFAHSTAILKATFSGLPQDAVVSFIKVGAAPYTISIPYTEGMDLAVDGIYIYLPNVAKDKNVVFSVETTAREVYTATQSVKLDEGIKEGSFYVAPIELTSVACELPAGTDFKSAIAGFLNGKELTEIKFIAKSVNTDNANPIGSSNAYMVANGNTLEIHTAAPQFVFNADCGRMFGELSNITSIDFGDNIDTSNVTSMSGMFMNCIALTLLDVSSFNTSNVMSMNIMFRGCSSLTSLDLSNFDTSNVTSMGAMFEGCSALTSLNVSSFNTSKVSGIDFMFEGCKKLTSLNLYSFDFSQVTGYFSYLFLDLGAEATEKPISVCVTKDSYDILKDRPTLINSGNAKYVFPCEFYGGYNFNNEVKSFLQKKSCSKIKFITNSRKTTVDYINTVYLPSKVGAYMWKNDETNTLEIHTNSSVFVFPGNCSEMFQGLTDITSIDFGDNIDTSNVEDMESMFAGCGQLTSLDLSGFNFGSVTDFTSMFTDLGKDVTNKPIPVWVKDAADETTLENASATTKIDSQYAEVQVKP